jgi:bloom syndrome protein
MQALMLGEFTDGRTGRVQCGIVYCLSRNDCEKVAEQLSRTRQRNGQLLKAHHYHASMDQVGGIMHPKP